MAPACANLSDKLKRRATRDAHTGALEVRVDRDLARPDASLHALERVAQAGELRVRPAQREFLEELAYACAERLLREHRTSGRCNRTDFDRNVGSQDFCGCDPIVD